MASSSSSNNTATQNTLKKAHESVSEEISRWLREVVIGLNLCPFASYPHTQNLIHVAVSDATSDTEILEALQTEIMRLEDEGSANIETSLLVLTDTLKDFEDYNQFLSLVDALLDANNWVGNYQVASFHPNYQFGGTHPDDTENLTNRAPYPILHIIREASLEKALADYPDAESIFTRNITTVSNLNEAQLHALFPYIYRQ